MSFTNAGYGGSNANASNAGPLANWGQISQGYNLNRGGVGYASLTDMLQGRQSGVSNAPGSNQAVYSPLQSGGGNGYASQFGFGGSLGFNQQAVQNLANQQLQAFNQANATNTGRWQQGVGYLQNAQQGYFNDPAQQGAQGLANYLTQNPNVLSQGVQNQIQNNAANMINANMGAQARQQAGILAGNGETDAGSLAAMNNQIYRQGVGQLGAVQSNLDIQAALQNRASTLQALQAGQSQAAQNYGVNQNMANSYLQNVLYQKPFDYSAFLPATMQSGGAAFGGGGGSGVQIGAGNFTSPTSGGYGSYLQRNNGAAGANTTSFGFGGPDGYANAAGGGPGAATPGMNYYGGYNTIYNPDGSFNDNAYADF